MSTPTSLELPDRVRRTTIRTARGVFAALEAAPASGVCERDAALLVPGYTGSKEDFLAILDLLADDSRHVVAIDMRGQFDTAGADEPGGYAAAALGADILAIMHATGARHLVGHSYGGLIGREAVLAAAGAEFASFTLMSSGPGALTGPRARDLRAMLAALGVRRTAGPTGHGGAPGRDRRALALAPGAAGRRGRRPRRYRRVPGPPDAGQRPGRAGPDGRAHAGRAGPDGGAGSPGPAADAGHLRRERQLLVPGRAGEHGPQASALAGCASRRPCTPPPSRRPPPRPAR